MDKITWKKLSPDAQKTWDTMPDAAKHIILQHAADRAAKAKDGTQMQVNQHETMSPAQDDVEAPDAPQDTPEDTIADVTAEINAVISSGVEDAHPGDLRRMMGAKKKSKPRLTVKFATFDAPDGDSLRSEDLDALLDGYDSDSSTEDPDEADYGDPDSSDDSADFQ